MAMVASPRRPAGQSLQRFCVVVRGDDFLVDEDGPKLKGFYVVCTAWAEDKSTAEKLALFDLQTDMHTLPSLRDLFLESGTLTVEEVRVFGEGEPAATRDFVFFTAL